MDISKILDLPALALSSLSALWRGALSGIIILWECACQMPWFIIFLILSAFAKRPRKR